jgi:hypothetical protein
VHDHLAPARLFGAQNQAFFAMQAVNLCVPDHLYVRFDPA